MKTIRPQSPTIEDVLRAHPSIRRLSPAERLPLEREWRKRAARRLLAREAGRS